MMAGLVALWVASYLLATYLPRRERRILTLGVFLGTGALIGLAAFVDTAVRVLHAVI